MKSHSELVSIIDNYPYPAQFKTADTGKYVFSNLVNARMYRMQDPRDLEGLTIHDLRLDHPEWGPEHAARIDRLDQRVRTERTLVTDRHPFFGEHGEVCYHEAIKFPVLGTHGNLLAIVSCAQDIKHTLSYPDLYRLYRHFYDGADAVKHMLTYLGGEAWFPRLPSEAQFRVFLEKAEGYTNKHIARRLRVASSTVESHLDAMREKIVDGDLHRAFAILRRGPQALQN
jgi:DNA-binding CsgD family transcriptional regulator